MTTAQPPSLEVEQNATGHFRLHLLHLIRRLVDNLYAALPPDNLEQLLREYPFIAQYRQQLHDRRLNGVVDAFEAGYEAHLPLRALQQELALSPLALQVLLAAGLIEEDIQFGSLFAALQQPLERRHPCLGILSLLLAPEAGSQAVVGAAEQLAAQGLLLLEREGSAARLEWTARVPLPLWDAVRGEQAPRAGQQIQFQPADSFPPLDQVIVPEGLQQQVARLPGLVASRQLNTLVLRGMTGAGRRTLLGAVARTLGRDLLLYQAQAKDDEARRLLGPLATATGALPAIRLSAGPGETVRLDPLSGYQGVVGVTMGRSGGIDGGAMDNALTLYLPPPDRRQRARFWQRAALPLAPGEAEQVTERFLLTGGRIHQVAAAAHNAIRLEGREEARAGDVRQAMRAVNRQQLETLAQPLEPVPGWSALVVPARVGDELRVLEARCRARERLLERVGPAFAHTLNRGVRALFSGPSGTGKTLAARALAGALQMDLYRVDLASVVNKYIGETEKNLHKILSRAEELDIILLLDEGDSLMARRTDVRGANDRYANLETNFLLQRLESYEGIILITTNAAQRIDDAFVRRLDVVVNFTLPDAAERRLLWQIHLPPEHDASERFFERVVARCKLTGGQIRNCALHASLLALRDGHPLDDASLDAALQREYRKASLPYPLTPLRRDR